MPVGASRQADRDVETQLSYVAGSGGDGVLRSTLNEGDIVEQSPLSMKVDVDTFRGFINQKIVKLLVKTATSTMTAPTGGSPGDLRRIDTVEYILGTGLNIVDGSPESASPSAPAQSSNSIKLGEVHHRNGETVIKDSDDTTNGFIVITGSGVKDWI